MKYRTCVADRGEIVGDVEEYWTIEGYPKGLTETECSEIVNKANSYGKLESENATLKELVFQRELQIAEMAAYLEENILMSDYLEWVK
tara:strand:+ start:1424 stop:1687 length:264 start_codon:yes stop_codon:yes gene_type:complete